MPILKGKSDKAVGENIKRQMAEGKPQKQAIAIALWAAGRSNKQKGKG